MAGSTSRESPIEVTLYNQPPVVPCALYTAFSTWVRKAILPTLTDANPATINQAYILLTHKYMEHYVSAPKRCRECVGGRGHRCIHTVLIETYGAIRSTELEFVPLPMVGSAHSPQNAPSATAIALPPIPVDEQYHDEEEDDTY